MSDVFHAHFSLQQIQQIFTVMNACPQHQFQLLTKRPERALRYTRAGEIVFTENVWIGTSIENMAVARRVDTLRQIGAHVRFLSCEPLLGPLDHLDLTGIHWVIGGGESGLGYRPCREEWAVGLRDLCIAEDVAFFWKQWGGRTPKSGGRLLEGREWNDYPQPLSALGR
jgi:protein gp37